MTLSLGLAAGIKNVGSGHAGPFVVEANGSRQTVTLELAPGQSTELWFPGYAGGVQEVLVDATFQVQESNEDNNRYSEMVPIPTPPPTCPPTPTPTPEGLASDDYGDEATTAEHMFVGESIIGSIEHEDDVDYFSFAGVAGQTYRAEVLLGTLDDSLLILYASDGVCGLTVNDDHDQTLGSLIQWILPSTGTYYLSVENADGVSTGNYVLTVDTTTGQPSDDHGIMACLAAGMYFQKGVSQYAFAK